MWCSSPVVEGFARFHRRPPEAGERCPRHGVLLSSMRWVEVGAVVSSCDKGHPLFVHGSFLGVGISHPFFGIEITWFMKSNKQTAPHTDRNKKQYRIS